MFELVNSNFALFNLLLFQVANQPNIHTVCVFLMWKEENLVNPRKVNFSKFKRSRASIQYTQSPVACHIRGYASLGAAAPHFILEWPFLPPSLFRKKP